MKAFGRLLVLCSVLLSACSQAPECKVQQDHIDLATGNAGCLLRQGTALLVVKQRISGRWNIPAGTSNNEPAQCTAHRETWEETGLHVEVGRLLKVFENEFRLYECHAIDKKLDVTKPLNTPLWGLLEVSEARWIRPEDIENTAWRYPKQLPEIRLLFSELTNKKAD